MHETSLHLDAFLKSRDAQELTSCDRRRGQQVQQVSHPAVLGPTARAPGQNQVFVLAEPTQSCGLVVSHLEQVLLLRGLSSLQSAPFLPLFWSNTQMLVDRIQLDSFDNDTSPCKKWLWFSD
jgi:hypothetical protein